MYDRIDQKFIDAIVAAKKRGALQITEEANGGARLQYPFLRTQVDMHLGARNYAIVKDALRKLDN